MPTGPNAPRAFRIAVAACKRLGLSNFKKGTKGAACRSRIAEGVAKRRKK